MAIEDVVLALQPGRDIWKNVVRLPPTYGTPFGEYDPTEDVTFRADEPQTYAQTMRLDPRNAVLPYVDPVADYYWNTQGETDYGAMNEQLDTGRPRVELPPMLDTEAIRGGMGLQQDVPAMSQPPLDPALVTRLSNLLQMRPQAPSVDRAADFLQMQPLGGQSLVPQRGARPGPPNDDDPPLFPPWRPRKHWMEQWQLPGEVTMLPQNPPYTIGAF